MDTTQGKPEREELLRLNENVEPEKEIVITSSENGTLVNMSKLGVIRNLLVISIAFMFEFSAFNSFASLQSSLNKEDGLGTTGLASLYLVMLLSSLLVSPVTMSKISSKWIMVASMFMYLIYILTGFYPSWYTVVPASVIIGIGSSHLWLSMQAYITDIAKHYAKITDTKVQDRLNLFLGVFYAFTYTCNIWGNLLSSFIFHRGDANVTVIDNVNESICGPHFCPYLKLNTSSVIEPTKQQVYIYTGACVGFVVLALTFMTFLVTDVSTEVSSSDVRTLVQQVTRQICFSRTQHLLLFPSLLGGLTFGFLAGDFTRAYITCSYGVKDIGFVMIVYGVFQSACSIIFGKLNQYTGHLVIFCFGFIVQAGLHVTMLLWTPNQSEQYVVFILSAMFGIVGAINVPMVSALYNLYFTKDRSVALSSFRMINSAGNAISLGYSNWLCMQYKLYILLSVLVLSFVSLIIQHIRHSRKSEKEID